MKPLVIVKHVHEKEYDINFYNMELAKLDLRPGDVLLIKASMDMRLEEVEQVKKKFAELVPENVKIVIYRGMDLGVIRE